MSIGFQPSTRTWYSAGRRFGGGQHAFDVHHRVGGQQEGRRLVRLPLPLGEVQVGSGFDPATDLSVAAVEARLEPSGVGVDDEEREIAVGPLVATQGPLGRYEPRGEATATGTARGIYASLPASIVIRQWQ